VRAAKLGERNCSAFYDHDGARISPEYAVTIRAGRGNERRLSVGMYVWRIDNPSEGGIVASIDFRDGTLRVTSDDPNMEDLGPSTPIAEFMFYVPDSDEAFRAAQLAVQSHHERGFAS